MKAYHSKTGRCNAQHFAGLRSSSFQPDQSVILQKNIHNVHSKLVHNIEYANRSTEMFHVRICIIIVPGRS
jgi:hypothetical protein